MDYHPTSIEVGWGCRGRGGFWGPSKSCSLTRVLVHEAAKLLVHTRADCFQYKIMNQSDIVILTMSDLFIICTKNRVFSFRRPSSLLLQLRLLLQLQQDFFIHFEGFAAFSCKSLTSCFCFLRDLLLAAAKGGQSKGIKCCKCDIVSVITIYRYCSDDLSLLQ